MRRPSKANEAIDRDRRRLLGTATLGAAVAGTASLLPALVFDLRQNGGGDPEMIRFLTSWLFDERTHLNDMVGRDGNGFLGLPLE
jgi:hypothetical protein